MEEFTITLGDIPVGIHCRYPFVRNFCAAYITDDTPILQAEATEQEIQAEQAAVEFPVTPAYAESLCIYRRIAEQIPLLDSVVFHGASNSFGGKAYLFTAPSGTGKTTHIRLWREYLGEKVDIVNGDKPILSFRGTQVLVCGTPYAGKEGWNRNISLPLGGICLLEQAKENRIRALDPGERVTPLLRQMYRPVNGAAMAKTLDLLDRLCQVPAFLLECDISEDAVKKSFAALTGRDYREERI